MQNLEPPTMKGEEKLGKSKLPCGVFAPKCYLIPAMLLRCKRECYCFVAARIPDSLARDASGLLTNKKKTTPPTSPIPQNCKNATPKKKARTVIPLSRSFKASQPQKAQAHIPVDFDFLLSYENNGPTPGFSPVLEKNLTLPNSQCVSANFSG